LPLPDVLVRLFRERKSETGKSEFVFPGKSGRTAVRDIDDSRLRIVRNSGVDFSLHDLRRTFATVATEIGVPPYLLKKLLNHRSGDVTEGYVISTSEILRGPMKKVASRLMDLCRMGSPFVVAKHPSSFSSKT
jgi:integrase